MKQTICYLYEYEHNKQSRNVGFIKCIFQQDKVTFQIHGKGLKCDKTMDLEMFLFTQEETGVKLDRTGVVEGTHGTVNYRVVVEQMNMETMNQYDGIILIAPSDKRYVATWKRKEIHLDYEDNSPKEVLIEQKPAPEVCDCEITKEVELEPESYCCEVVEEIEPQPESYCCEVEEMEPESESCSCEVIPEIEAEPESCGCGDDVETEVTYEKIQRQDIARLQQREWRIANNNFLIHGYANYKHLIFVRKDGNLYLGVPGVYHKKEAEVAHSFGFSMFHKIENNAFYQQLDEREYSPEEGFGYWCRPVVERRIR